jgi:hypothetical protein
MRTHLISLMGKVSTDCFLFPTSRRRPMPQPSVKVMCLPSGSILHPVCGSGTNKQDMVDAESQSLFKKRSLSWSPLPCTAPTERREALLRNGHAQSAQTAVSLPCVRTAKSREPYSPCLSTSAPPGDSARLSGTPQFARLDPYVGCLSHHRVQLDQKKVAHLPPFSPTLVAPDPEDPTSTTLQLDELWSFVLKKAHESWIWMALCRKTGQVLASAPSRSQQKGMSTLVGGHSRQLPPGTLQDATGGRHTGQ